jgi:Uma2 family endonuclease
MSTAPGYVPRYTTDDYAAWDGEWELLDGVAVAMTPSPFGSHAEKLSRLAADLWNAIDAAGCHATVLAEIDWIVARDTVVRPDLVIVCGPAPAKHVNAPPALVIEILSATTRERDLTVKRELYEAQGVRWYVIVDPDQDQSTVLRLSASGQYEPRDATDPLKIDLCADCTITLSLKRTA